jgi:phenylpropionate dioxygenase-like ring-hydroxylating dioxygenase large terminal subunit
LLREENELLSRVGKGTPMGDFMRQFWIPAFLGARLEPDGPPERIRLLGQDFVAFRATDGRVGFLDEGCPHRGVSLALARNENCALQCIFHGWKIDVSGKVVDVPAEPPEQRAQFMARIKVNHYPVREAAGIVFVWLGGGEPAPFQDLQWTSLLESHLRLTVGIIKASWLNGLEGQLDSAHVGILHQDWVTRDRGRFGTSNIDHTTVDLAPRFEFEIEPYGYREAAIRSMPDGRHYVRVREFVMPWYSYIPQQGGRAAMQLMTISVPVDDEHSAQWDVRYSLAGPLADNAIFAPLREEVMAQVRGGAETRWGQDRGRVAEGRWSGFSAVRHEDYAVAMAQGAIADRTAEHLATSDLSIVRARRQLLAAVRDHQEGKAPPSRAAIDWPAIRSFAEIIPAETDWRTLPR